MIFEHSKHQQQTTLLTYIQQAAARTQKAHTHQIHQYSIARLLLFFLTSIHLKAIETLLSLSINLPKNKGKNMHISCSLF